MLLRLLQAYKSIIHGVAFLPLLITAVLTAAGLILTGQSEEGSGLPENMRVNTVETARVLLGSILTGVISLTVFSFSMMMVVVNQASSNYSPKVVETFINERFNKVILGIYLGTIVFTIVVLMHLDGQQGSEAMPHLAILVNIVLGILTAILFLAFINNIF